MTTEASEQAVLVRELRRAGVRFCAVPNGGRRDRRGAVSLKAQGVVPGVPDLLIFDRPNRPPGAVGVAIELKRQGAPPSAVSAVQREWLEALEARGWVAFVARGAIEALGKLVELGFEVRSG